jgi:hypothetical protein
LSVLKGSVPLVDSIITEDVKRGAKNFVIKTREGVNYYIEAENETEKNAWMKALLQASSRFQQSNDFELASGSARTTTATSNPAAPEITPKGIFQKPI